MVAGLIHARNCLTELFFGLYAVAFIASSTARKTVQQEGHLAGGFDHANLSTPLAGNIHPPSEVAAIFRTVPPPKGYLPAQILRPRIELDNGIWLTQTRLYQTFRQA